MRNPNLTGNEFTADLGLDLSVPIIFINWFVAIWTGIHNVELIS